jgi:hypothetical protein
MRIDENTKTRLYEIGFYEILDNLTQSVGNEKVDYFLEHFCKMFDMDFTSISIVKNMYFKRMRPDKREHSLFFKFTEMPLSKLKIDYRTYRKYRKDWELSGMPQLQPNIVNEFLKPEIKKFVDNYIRLMYDNLYYIKRLGEIDFENGDN